MKKPRYLTLSARAFELALTLPADQQAEFNRAVWGMYQALLNGDKLESVQQKDPLLSVILDMIQEELVSGFNTYVQRTTARLSSGKIGDASANVQRSVEDESTTDNKNRKEHRRTDENGNKLEKEMDDPGFDRFWSLYPVHVAQAEARRVWADLKPDESLAAEIVKGLERWLGSEEWCRDGGKYIPHAHNFLLKRRWIDEPRKLKAVPSVPAQDFRQRDYGGVEHELLANLSSEIAAAKAQGII